MDARSLVELTDELLLTEQPVPRWLAVAWSDALAAAGPPPVLDTEPGD